MTARDTNPQTVEAGPATLAMLEALAELHERNRATPCQNPDDAHKWTSEDARERADAATRCTPCPLLAACGRAADERGEVWWVWAGVDRAAAKRKSTANPRRKSA